MLNINKSGELFLKIYENSDLNAKVINYISENAKKIEKYVESAEKGKWQRILRKDAFFKLCVAVAYLPITKEKYEKKGIGDDIFFDTMNDIKIWIDDNFARTGEYGLAEMNWIYHHLSLEIFKLGRLQYHLIKYRNKPFKSGDTAISFGNLILNLHIPRGGRLTKELCVESIEKAKMFFQRFYPEYPLDRFVCDSWLLYSGNKNYMKPDSNILKFASMFQIADENEAPSQAYLWLFGKQASNITLMKNKRKTGNYGLIDTLPCETDLQKSAIDYILSGGKLGDALGVLLARNI